MLKDKDILVLGKGFIGTRIADALGCQSSGLKLRSFSDVERVIALHRPKVLINCIGYTGENNVDDCELDKDKTLFANACLPLLLQEAALRFGIKLVHLSSGCIYHYDYKKDRPITEGRRPDFLDLYYSRSKIYAELALGPFLKTQPTLIVRLRIPLDDRPHPRNILTKLIGYRRVIDLPNSVSYLPDFIEALKHLIRIDGRGIFNVTNAGALRYPELLDVYKRFVTRFEYRIVPFKTLGLVRTNLILSTRKLKMSGFKVRHIREVLEQCVRNYLAY